jgi:hypothetical protein
MPRFSPFNILVPEDDAPLKEGAKIAPQRLPHATSRQ